MSTLHSNTRHTGSAQDLFTEIPLREWEEAAARTDGANVFMEHAWETALAKELPFVEFRHFRYNDTHLLRVAKIGGRRTTVPFSEGSDVVALGGAVLELGQFEADATEYFGQAPRLRINERFAPFEHGNDGSVAAHEYVLDLGEPILPRVRKTLRHILSREPTGTIERSTEDSDIDAAYQLYVRHMRSVRNFAMPDTLFRSLIREHGSELWVWRNDGVPRAGAIFLPGNDEVLYSLSAADGDALSAHAPHHLVYAALEAYRDAGYTRASLGATGVGSALEVFKRGWRGDQYRITELGARSLGVGRTSQVRALAGYVPLSLYPSLTSIAGRYLF